MKDATARRLSKLHTVLYQATDGFIGRRLVNNDMLLVTTTGRRTGKAHTVPLLYLTSDDRLIVIASFGGRPDHPSWYENLLAEPAATVQILGESRAVTASTMSTDERAVWWPRVVDAYSDYAVYQSKTDREIPLVWLD